MDIVLRAAVIFVVLWIVIRVSGKREIAQLSAFDLIVDSGETIHPIALAEDADGVSPLLLDTIHAEGVAL